MEFAALTVVAAWFIVVGTIALIVDWRIGRIMKKWKEERKADNEKFEAETKEITAHYDQVYADIKAKYDAEIKKIDEKYGR